MFSISVSNAQITDLKRSKYFIQGSFEFSFFTNIGISTANINETLESTGFYAENIENKEEEDVFQIGASAGYYFLDKLSFEPQVDVNLTSTYTSFALVGNLSYSFTKAASNIVPFIKIGYGWSGYKNDGLGDTEDSKGFTIINTGFGIKKMYSKDTIFKIEINYRILNASVSTRYIILENYHLKTSDINMNVFSVSLGVAFLF